VPHNNVIQQGDGSQSHGEKYDEDNNFYFVGKGYCKVTIKDKKGREVFIKNIHVGEHFGEISLIYDCLRTANIISMNYNTFAMLRPQLFFRLVQEYPEYERCLKDYITTQYDDFRLKFLLNMIKRVDYFSQTPIDILYDIVFKLEIKTFSKEYIILDDKTVVNAIFFIEEGIIQVETNFDNNSFIIDKLGPGSIIN